MSTTGGSEQGTVYVLDEPEAIEKKFKSAVTDSGSEVRRAPEKPGIEQPDRDPRRRARRSARRRSKPSSQRRALRRTEGAVAAAVIDYLAPVRERYAELRADEARSRRSSPTAPSARARSPATTLADVRERMGVGAPGADGDGASPARCVG